MPGGTWTAAAFGLTVRGSFPVPGLDGRREPVERRVVDVLLAPRHAIAAAAPAPRIVRCEARDARGALALRIERAADGTHVLRAPSRGTFLVAADGRKILVAPVRGARWLWQRVLLAQALPLAAVLQGVETLHASAVVLADGTGAAFTGASLAGKTTLAAAMLETDARLLSDDVLAVEGVEAGVLAHPAPPLMNLRCGGEAALGAPPHGARAVGRGAGARALQFEPHRAPVPLRALFVLDRSARHATLTLEPLEVGAAALLLASSFNFIIEDRARLERQLDICARIARAGRVVRVRAPLAVRPAELAAHVAAVVTEERRWAA